MENEVDLLAPGHSAPGDSSAIKPPDDAERKLYSEMLTLYEEAKAARQERIKLQDYYRLMLKGEVLLARTKNSSEVLRLVETGDPRRPRSVDNLMRTMHRAFVAKLIKAIPSVKVRPRTNDKSDLMAAEVMDSWSDFGWNAQKFRLKFKRAVECISWAGMGIHMLWWDALGGREVGVCPKCGFASPEHSAGDPCPKCQAQAMGDITQLPMAEGMPELQQLDEQLQQAATQNAPLLERAFEGEPKLDVVHPFDFYPDPGAATIDVAQYVCISRARPVNEIRRDFPEMAEAVNPEDGLYTDKYVTGLSGLGGARVQTIFLKNHARQIDIYLAPGGEHPDGRIITMCNNRILDEKPNYYWKWFKRPNFFCYRGDTDLGELWAEEIISQAEGLQRERDIATSQVRRSREQALQPKWTVGWNAGVDAKVMSGTPGEIIKQKPTAIPLKPLNMPELPAWTPGELQRLKEAQQEKFGLTPYELGQTSAGDSGRFAAFLDTQAQGVISGMLVEIHEEWLDMHRCWIILGQKMMPKERIWTVTGRDKVLAYSWGKADVKPGWDVYLATEDSLSKNPVLRLQQAREFLRDGMFNDPRTGIPDMKRYARMAGVNLDQLAPDADSAERIFAAQLPEVIKQAMEEGQPPPYYQPMPYDDATIFAEELLGWLRTAGRSEEPALVQEILRLWLYYAQALLPADPNMMPDPLTVKLLPNGGRAVPQPGQPQAPSGAGQAGPGAGGAPQGGPQQVGGVPSKAPSPEQETAQKIQATDRANEARARMQSRHEG